MSDVFFYFSNSADKKPGYGKNETLNSTNATVFSDLELIKDWRKILSNFHEGEFEYNKYHYKTAEHAFQGTKIQLVDTAKSLLFTTESGSALSRGDGNEARKNRKIVVLTPAQLTQWSQIKDNVLTRILLAKFSQVESAKQVLLATKSAELWHGTRGVPKARQFALETVRANINADNADSVTELVETNKKRKIESSE